MGGRDLPLKYIIGRMAFCLATSAKPGAHCGLRLSESVELQGMNIGISFASTALQMALPNNSTNLGVVMKSPH